MAMGGTFCYEAWCAVCMAVRPHLHGDCLTCHPNTFPRRAFEQAVADQRIEVMTARVFLKPDAPAVPPSLLRGKTKSFHRE